MFRRLLDSIRKAAGHGTHVAPTHWDEESKELHAEIEFKVSLVEDEVDGGYVVECLNLPGCMSQGETIEEAVDNIGEAIAGVLAARLERNLRAQEAVSEAGPHQARELTVPLQLGRSGRDHVPA
ncbi:MAG: type II toxin-antitoxin system HicB family antitoxin [Solirubrobacterales bacterium]